jgi:hypothetical protein
MDELQKNLLEEIAYLREQEENWQDALDTGMGDKQEFRKLTLIYYRARIRAERELVKVNEALNSEVF